MRTALALSAVALLACACEQSLPPEERGTIVVPATPQATGAAAPLVAPTTPYETSGTTQRKQEESGYFPTAGSPLVPETSAAFSIRGPNRALMRGMKRRFAPVGPALTE